MIICRLIWNLYPVLKDFPVICFTSMTSPTFRMSYLPPLVPDVFCAQVLLSSPLSFHEYKWEFGRSQKRGLLQNVKRKLLKLEIVHLILILLSSMR